MWSETMGMSIEKVNFSISDTTREWFLQGAFDGLQFSLKIFCGTNVVKNFIMIQFMIYADKLTFCRRKPKKAMS